MGTIQISFRNMDPVPAAEAQIRTRIAELQLVSDRMTGCRVVLDAAHRHQRHGRLYDVHIELSVPGGPVVITHGHGDDPAHAELNVAVRDAFDAARRRLQDHMQRLEEAGRPHAPG